MIYIFSNFSRTSKEDTRQLLYQPWVSNGGGIAGRGDGWTDVRNTLETEGLLKNSPRLPIPGSAFLCQVNPERKGIVEGLLANTLALPDVLPEEVIFKPFFLNDCGGPGL